MKKSNYVVDHISWSICFSKVCLEADLISLWKHHFNSLGIIPEVFGKDCSPLVDFHIISVQSSTNTSEEVGKNLTSCTNSLGTLPEVRWNDFHGVR